MIYFILLLIAFTVRKSICEEFFPFETVVSWILFRKLIGTHVFFVYKHSININSFAIALKSNIP